MLLVCLVLAGVFARSHAGHMPHVVTASLPQSVHCDHAGSGAPNDGDCADLCPICQISLKDVALLPPVTSVVGVAIIATTLATPVDVPTPWSHFATRGHHARAPPALRLIG